MKNRAMSYVCRQNGTKKVPVDSTFKSQPRMRVENQKYAMKWNTRSNDEDKISVSNSGGESLPIYLIICYCRANLFEKVGPSSHRHNGGGGNHHRI